MDKVIIRQNLISILERVTLRNFPDFSDNLNLGDDGLGIDSMSFLKFLTEVEEEFNIEIEDNYWNYNKLNNMQKVVDYVYIKSN